MHVKFSYKNGRGLFSSTKGERISAACLGRACGIKKHKGSRERAGSSGGDLNEFGVEKAFLSLSLSNVMCADAIFTQCVIISTFLTSHNT